MFNQAAGTRRPTDGTRNHPGHADESRLAHLCSQRPQRVAELIGTAKARGDEEGARRAALALLSSPLISGAIESAVRGQTFRSASHERDELVDGARLAIVEQIAREVPPITGLGQFRGWATTIARRHVISVTRLKREGLRRSGASLDAGSDEPGGCLAIGDRTSPSPEERCAGDWAVVTDALAVTGELERTVVTSHLVLEQPASETVALVAQRHGQRIGESAVARISGAFVARCRAANA